MRTSNMFELRFFSDVARRTIKFSQAEQLVEKQLKSSDNNFDGDEYDND
jgi:hypothetical protein